MSNGNPSRDADGSDDDAATEPAGDDALAAPGASGAGLGTQADFFEGLGAQIGKSDAALAPCRRSVPPQCCCAAVLLMRGPFK